MNCAYLLLGSNVEKEKNIPEAIDRLKHALHVTAVSSVHETEPVGDTDQAHYWNVAVLVETDLTAEALKTDVLRPIEREMHRVRTGNTNAPRTIDIDIILFNDNVIDADVFGYAHVAVPLAEIAPNFLLRPGCLWSF
jgi:2-amino-4-hydroxy-6-hydroxymethyldihydropteridine diphosphokinase